MATGIWVRLMRKTHIDRDVTIPCMYDEWQEALESACQKLDVPKPLMLSRHERDFLEFSQTRFLKEHFIEDVAFDRMEVEYIDPDKKHKDNPLYY